MGANQSVLTQKSGKIKYNQRNKLIVEHLFNKYNLKIVNDIVELIVNHSKPLVYWKHIDNGLIENDLTVDYRQYDNTFKDPIRNIFTNNILNYGITSITIKIENIGHDSNSGFFELGFIDTNNIKLNKKTMLSNMKYNGIIYRGFNGKIHLNGEILPNLVFHKFGTNDRKDRIKIVIDFDKCQLIFFTNEIKQKRIFKINKNVNYVIGMSLHDPKDKISLINHIT